MTSGLLILAVVILHNLLGYLIGFGVGSRRSWIPFKAAATSFNEAGKENLGSIPAGHHALSSIRQEIIPGAGVRWHNDFMLPVNLYPHRREED